MLLSCEVLDQRAHRQEVGGKAFNLLRLRSEGLRVPPFWVVPRAVFDEIVERCRDTVEGALGREGPSDPDGAARAAGQIGAALSACPFPPPLAAAVGALPEGRLFAVRSSAIAEDSAQHSFAGLLDSVLNVPRADLPAAIRRVWASAFSARALLYRQRKGLPLEATATAVVVQEMVQAACAGVLFTRDPADGGKRIVISAGLGLGEGVVADAVESDTYRIGWDDNRITRELRAKVSRIVLADPHRGGTREEPVSERIAQRPALRQRQVRRLRDLGRHLERTLGGPQDVEWAHDARGRLFVLQARPIVNGSRSSNGPLRIWDNANIVESYPGLTLPLTFSFARRSYRRTFARVAQSFLALARNPSPEVYDGLIGLLNGRVYYNLLAWYEMFSYLPGSGRYQQSWDRLIGVTRHSVAPPARAVGLARAGTLATSIAMLLRVKSLRARFFARFDALRSRHAAAGMEEATAEEVLARFAAIEEEAGAFWHLTIQNDFCALKYHQWLARLVERWGPSSDPGLLNALLAGQDRVESVAPVRSLLALAESVRSDPSCLELLRGDDGAIWAEIAREPRWSALREEFHGHLRAFGDRSVAELKLETVTFEEDPARLVGLVKHYLRLGLSLAELDRQRAEPAARAAALRRNTVKGVLERMAFRFVLDRARIAIRAREDMRLARTRLFGIVRRLFRRLGELLHEQDLLESPSDVHYLTVEELMDLVRGTGATGAVKALAALRRSEYAAYAGAPAPSRIETVGIPRPNPVRGPEEVAGQQTILQGTGCSRGLASGRATVVLDPERAVSGRDRILVAASTDPGWVFLMMSSAGIVVERGSPLSHTAIIGRELGIPTVVGAAGATRLIPEGAPLRIDGSTGAVRWA